jgi:transcriptional regulator with XRE-family HTH domain
MLKTKNVDQLFPRLIYSAPREKTATHKSDDAAGPAHGPTSWARRSHKGRQLVGEQFMGSYASHPLDRREMARMNASSAVEPLPNKALRDTTGLRQRGLASSDADSLLDCLSLHPAETSRASRSIQEPGSWRARGGINSVAPMSKKRPLTDEEERAAAVIKQAIESGNKTQDEIAAEVGVTQGMIWQWMNAKLPVPARRAQKLAAAIGLNPVQVSVAWRNVVRDAKKLTWPFPRIDPTRWAELSPGEKIRIEGLVLGAIVDIEDEHSKGSVPRSRANR